MAVGKLQKCYLVYFVAARQGFDDFLVVPQGLIAADTVLNPESVASFEAGFFLAPAFRIKLGAEHNFLRGTAC